MKEIFPGVYAEGRKLYTLNTTPAQSFFDEQLLQMDGKEYREWSPMRSKLAAAIVKGLTELPIRPNCKILYLGAAHGYTVSFLSDIARDGLILAVDFAPRVVRDLVFVAEKRKNVLPILASANHPESYYNIAGAFDLVYQDVAQKNQIDIFLKNCNMLLKPGGFGMLALKARSVDVTQNPQMIFLAARKELEKKLLVKDMRNLNPMQKDHVFFLCEKKT
jgi:fibrillarin-like pre-rRNA processing protein